MLFGHRSRPIFALLLSQRYKFGDFVLIQDSAPYSARYRAKATQDNLRNIVPHLQWKRRLTALQQSQSRMGTNSAHFQLNAC